MTVKALFRDAQGTMQVPSRSVDLVRDTFGVATFGIVNRQMQLQTQAITMLRPDDMSGQVALVGRSPQIAPPFCARAQPALRS